MLHLNAAYPYRKPGPVSGFFVPEQYGLRHLSGCFTSSEEGLLSQVRTSVVSSVMLSLTMLMQPLADAGLLPVHAYVCILCYVAYSLACRQSPLHPGLCAYALLTVWAEYCLLNEGIEPDLASVFDLAHVIAPVGQSCMDELLSGCEVQSFICCSCSRSSGPGPGPEHGHGPRLEPEP